MSLLSRGPETVQLHPGTESTDGRGNISIAPTGDPPVPLEGVWVFPVGSVGSLTVGQTADTEYQLICTSFPAGVWSRLAWDGRDWDVIGEPMRFPGSARVRSDVVNLKARGPEVITDG